MMPSASVEANEICYGAALSACEKGSQWIWALNLLEVMENEQVPVDDTWHTVDDGFRVGFQREGTSKWRPS